MKNLVVLAMTALALSACGASDAIKATRSMPDKMDAMKRGMDHTNEIADLAAAFMAFEAMLKPEFGRDLEPVPYDIMVLAKKFVVYVKTEDFVELVNVWMEKLNGVQLEDPENVPADVKAEFDQRKMQTLQALQAVCGFLPQAKVQKILEGQIYHSGRYKTAALNMLMLRARFLNAVMLRARILDKGIVTVGNLEEAIEHNDQIEYIARLPFAADISAKVTTFADPRYNFDESLDPGMALTNWRDIKRKANRTLKVDPASLTGNPGRDQELYREALAKQQRGLSTVESRIRSWGAVP